MDPPQKREEEPPSPLTVKDLMLNVIEMQLLKNRSKFNFVFIKIYNFENFGKLLVDILLK